MASGRSLVLRYFPNVAPKTAWSPSWGPARMDADKRARKDAQQLRRREARARRQARV